MSRYEISFWFEQGGFCIWGVNSEAKEKYGYAIKNNVLPISENLISQLDDLEQEYGTYLDWNNPLEPSPWSKEHKEDFINRANITCEKLKIELGSEFEINNKVTQCVE